MTGTSTLERVARARAALAAAERRTGARSVLTGELAVGGTVAAPSPAARAAARSTGARSTAPGAPASAPDPAGETAPDLPGRAAAPTARVVASPAATEPRGDVHDVLRERAEHLAGVRPVPDGAPASAPSSAVPAASAVPAVLAEDAPTRRTSLLTSERPPLPVPPPLADLLPDGLRRGATTTVLGSTSLALGVLAHACASGAWAVAVGHPRLGLLAAAQAGVDLARFALVPDPGPDAATVLAALVDGIDVVLVGPDAPLADADRRRLSARARERGAALVTTVAWPGAHVVLEAGAARWSGVGVGDGRLRTCALTVRRTGRGSAAVPTSADVVLPFAPPGEHVPAGPVRRRTPAAGGLRLVG
ncbi:hypothetical protein [Cellulomonas sp. HD19AZ1]|uniref:hypothetical protein n=1 Tax=Cellulomonas sp. HD19AZ1 TaxID=2559593 RepID=UPI001070DFDD|nr:hypothetical protein [Cellulomonas sp. HD19AZ1]TFH74434.1 hypothetical protein E4A51_03095 [Cellulomonas sp. HD19AZ1]